MSAWHRHWKNMNRKIVASLLATSGVWLVAVLLGATRDIGYRFVWVLMAAVVAMAGFRFLMQSDVRSKRLYGILGFLFATAQALGYRLQLAGHSGVDGLLLCLGMGLCFAPAMGYGWMLLAKGLDAAQSRGSRDASPSPRKVFLFSFFVIFVCWLPVLLAYYPGLFAYDINNQMNQVISGQYTTHHPLLHTLYVGVFYLLGGAVGDHNIGIALSVLIQMLAMAAIFAWLQRYMAVIGSKRIFRVISLAGFALLPMHPMLAISCTKDTLFCGVVLLLAIRLHQAFHSPEIHKNKRWLIATACNTTIACLLRNNAIFSILLFVPICWLAMPKAYRLRSLSVVFCGMIVYLGAGLGLKTAMNAGDVNSAEFLSIPSQQMARVYTLYHGVYPPSAEIEAYLPAATNYAAYTADPVKNLAEIRKPGQLWGFLKLWGKVGLQFPTDYLDAFLLNTQGYWWLDDTTHAHIYGEGLGTGQGYLLTDTKEGYGVVHQNLFPPLETLLENLFSANEYQRVPVASLLFAPGLYLWLTAFGLARAVVNRRRDIAMVCGYLLCYLFTLLFGPCVLIRYAYPLVVCLPLYLLSPLREAPAIGREGGVPTPPELTVQPSKKQTLFP